MSEPIESSLLVVVVDTNLSCKLMQKGKQVATDCLDGVIVFCNSHLKMSNKNELAVIGCHAHKNTFLYPCPQVTEDTDIRSTDGQYELLTQVQTCIKERIKEFVQSSPELDAPSESLLAGAMSMGLCYANRIQRQKSKVHEMQARMLVVTSSGDSASQYMNFMNVFFTAQKFSITIDACVLEKESSLLQQGCDITDGIYLKVPNLESFLQYLVWVFLPDNKTRKELVLPSTLHVDYRAACFCHRNLIETGFVCSVCLSIYCTFSPICTTCQTAFKFLPLVPPKVLSSKKKSKKQRLL